MIRVGTICQIISRWQKYLFMPARMVISPCLRASSRSIVNIQVFYLEQRCQLLGSKICRLSFHYPPPPPQKFNEPMPPSPHPTNMGLTKDIMWKTMTFLCSYLSLCGVVTSLCLVVSSLCLVVTSVCLVVTSLFGLFTDVMWFRLYVLLTSLPVQSSSTQALLVTSN